MWLVAPTPSGKLVVVPLEEEILEERIREWRQKSALLQYTTHPTPHFRHNPAPLPLREYYYLGVNTINRYRIHAELKRGFNWGNPRFHSVHNHPVSLTATIVPLLLLILLISPLGPSRGQICTFRNLYSKPSLIRLQLIRMSDNPDGNMKNAKSCSRLSTYFKKRRGI
jgi:hypothetical protein